MSNDRILAILASPARTPEKTLDIWNVFLYTVRSGEHQSDSVATSESGGNPKQTQVRGEVTDGLSEMGVSPLRVGGRAR
jgi:hypothetical protein